MAKATWKGLLKFKMVTVPVKLLVATKDGQKLKFTQLHDKCGVPIKQEKVCPKCHKTLASDQIVKGFKYGDDFIIITQDEFTEAQKDRTDSIEIVSFCKETEINPIYFSDSHYLIPDRAGAEPFAIIRQALKDTNKVAIGKIVLRNKERIMAIKPHNNESLIAFSLHYQDEIAVMDVVLDKQKVDKGALKLTKDLIENMTSQFNPLDYKDEYTSSLEKVIQDKASGKIKKAQQNHKKSVKKVVTFMDALTASLEEPPKSKKRAIT